MKRVLAVAFLCAALSACANIVTTTPTPEALATFNGGNAAIIIINTNDGLGCDQMVLAIHRAGADKNEVVWTLRQAGYATSEPAIAVVPPGTYHISGGTCLKAGYYPSQMSSLPVWFGSAEVKAGEVVYLGTLDSELLDFKTQMGSFMKAMVAILFAAPRGYDFHYPMYQLSDHSSEVLERLRVNHPELASKMIVRLAPQLISKESFTAALQRAYAANPDGTLPTAEQAQARLPGEIEKVLAERRARVQSASPGPGPTDGKQVPPRRAKPRTQAPATH